MTLDAAAKEYANPTNIIIETAMKPYQSDIKSLIRDMTR